MLVAKSRLKGLLSEIPALKNHSRALRYTNYGRTVRKESSNYRVERPPLFVLDGLVRPVSRRNFCVCANAPTIDAELVNKVAHLLSRTPGKIDKNLMIQLVDELEMEQGNSASEKNIKTRPSKRYLNKLKLCQKARDFKLALEIYDEMIQRRVKLDTSCLLCLLETLDQAGLPTKALAIYERFKEECSKDFDISVLLIRLYSCVGDLEKIDQTWKKIHESRNATQGQINEASKHRLLSMIKLGRYTQAANFYEGAKGRWKEGQTILQAMIQVYSNLDLSKKVILLLYRLEEKGGTPTAATCYRAIESLLLEGRTNEARNLHEYLIRGLGEINAVSFEQIQIIAKDRSGTPETVSSDLLAKLEQQDWIEPKVEEYEKVIAAHSRSGNLKLANEALKHLHRSAKLTPTQSMFESILLGAIRLRNACLLYEILEEMKRYNMWPNTKVCGEIALFDASRFDVDNASKWTEKLLDQSTHVGEYTWIGLLEFWIQQNPLKAEQIYLKLENQKRTAAFYNVGLKLYLAQRNSDGMSKVIDKLRSSNGSPTVHTFEILMSFYYEQQDYLAVISTYRQITENKLIPNLEVGKLLVKALGVLRALKDRGVQKFLQRELEQYNWPPESEFLQCIENSCNESKVPMAYQEYVKILRTKYQLELDASHYVLWLSACLDSKNLNEALHLARKLIVISKEKPHMFKRAFPCVLSLHISKLANPYIADESLKRWIVDPANPESEMPLTRAEVATFTKDLAHWTGALFCSLVDAASQELSSELAGYKEKEAMKQSDALTRK